MSSARAVHRELRALANARHAAAASRFFKTGPGEYGEGDRFLGIRVPLLRGLAASHRGLPLDEVRELLSSPIHEARLLALLILVRQFTTGGERDRQAIYRLYMRHRHLVNNWDLVDCSAEHVVGAHLRDRARHRLFRLAKSRSLWDRRIAIMATFHYVKRGEFDDTLRLAEVLLHDPHDLIHKAVGWMLREVGNRNRPLEEAFLRTYASQMPRTMLRYAIERFPEPLRRRYLALVTAAAER